ncbi:MAG: DUF447 family protein [Euryarchaeota archaeon]|nr:DUF447 family protein [Euryarchaeota archaeon]
MLHRLGFKKGGIAECIVTTRNRDGSANAAPMGVYTIDDSTVAMKLHAGSDTLRNLTREGRAALNITFDPLLFLRTALVKGSPEVEKHEVSTTRHGIPYLKHAHAYAALQLEAVNSYSLTDSLGKSRVSVVRCGVTEVRILRPFPQAPCRGFFAALELAIDLSRGKTDRREELMRVMRRTLPAGEYERIVRLLDALNPQP